MTKKILPLGFSITLILVLSWLAPAFAGPMSSAQTERDEIFMLTAYSVVLNDWQTRGPTQRGHNIGSILVDENGKVVWWARNCNARLNNGTQHGEVRLIVGYLNNTPGRSTLDGCTVYTSLEPCAQCSGMMALTKLTRTVYGQTDPGYGKAIERLALNSLEWNKDGYKSYPRADRLISDRSECEFCDQLDKAYDQKNMYMTGFLLTDEAKRIYQAASDKLQKYKVAHPENQAVLDDAKQFLQTRVYPGVQPIILEASTKHTRIAPARMARTQQLARKHTIYGVPIGDRGNTLVAREIYCLSNNDRTKFADWVAYRLDKKSVTGKSVKERNWQADPELGAGTLEPSDYQDANKVLGTDRGHQAPLASFKGTDYWRETNYLSNITPQKSDLNRYSWGDLEDKVRALAEKGTVFVVTGPLYERPMGQLPGTKKAHMVPSGYWKIIAAETENAELIQVVGFIFEQETPRNAKVKDHVVTVNEIEERSGIDFFWLLPDTIEETVEGKTTLQWQ